MIKALKRKEYGKEFWIAVFSIIIFIWIFWVVSNYTRMPQNQILDEAIQYSHEISDALYEMEIKFDQYGEIINQLSENHVREGTSLPDNADKLERLQKQLHIMLEQFEKERKIVTGYFFQLNASVPATDYEVYYNGDKTAHISTLMSTVDLENINNGFKESGEHIWKTYYNAFADTVHLQYILPLYENGEYIGFMGAVIDTDYLKEVITVKQTGKEFGMLTDSKEVLIHSRYLAGESLGNLYEGRLAAVFDESLSQNVMRIRDSRGRSVIYAYTVLPSGQIFLEAQELAVYMARANLLTFCVGLISILILSVVQKDRKTGRSTFDFLSERLIAMKGSRLLSEDEENRSKAIIALELGICMMLTVYGLYQAVFMHRISDFLVCILLSLGIHFFLYLYIKGKVNEFQKFIFVCLLFLVTVIFHVMQGGFGEKGTGAAISWMLGILIFGSFLVKEKRMNEIFSVFVIFLLVDVLIELYFLQNIYYERMFVYVTSLFYVGFSLYTAASIYLRESVAEGKKITQLLEEVKETQSFLFQQEKKAALGQLISGVAHEINTPVGAIKGAAQTMESGLLPMLKLLQRCNEEFEEADYKCFFQLIDLASDGIKQMKSTIEIRQAKGKIEHYLEKIHITDKEDILEMLIRLEITDIEKLEEKEEIFDNPDLGEILKIVGSLSGFIVGIQTILFATNRVMRIAFALNSYGYTGISDEMVEIDLIKNIENILILYHNQLKQNIEVIKVYEDEIPHIWGKPDELAQVWVNLIQNAIFAMKEGGELTIRVKRKNAMWLEISIKDTGAGIPESVIEKIYDPFFTTKPLGEGSGLGLDISRKVVLAHGGTIQVESEPLKGTTFVIQLPLKYQDDGIRIKETSR